MNKCGWKCRWLCLASLLMLTFGSSVLALNDTEVEQPEDTERVEDYDPVVRKIYDKFGKWEDEDASEKVDEIAGRLLAKVDEIPEDAEIKYHLLEEDLVNAFALGDGNIFLFRGLIERAETDDQLAAIMAHELTHVIHEHHSKGIETVSVIQLLGLLGAIVAEEQELAMAGMMISNALMESYGREAEVDSDITGVDLMTDAGYDPLAMIEFFTYMQGLERRRPRLEGNYFTIHPHADERIQNLRDHLTANGFDVPDDLFRLHLVLDMECKKMDEYYECTIFVGEVSTFVLASEDEAELLDRGFVVLKRLGTVFAKGIRDYEVYSREGEGVYYLSAKGDVLITVTDADEKYLAADATTLNSIRLENIKFILWEYYIERRI